MKKKIPELLARFNQIKESGGLSVYTNSTKINNVERELLERLFEMGDNDFHSLNGIPTDILKTKSKFSDVSSSGIFQFY